MHPLLEEVTNRRSRHMPAQLPQWQSLAAALQQFCDAADAARILADLSDPAAGRRLMGILARSANAAAQLQDFLAAAADSEESLEQWILALDVMLVYLQSTSLRPNLSRVTGYLECCASVVGSSPKYDSFAGTVGHLLEVYGFDPEA